MEAEEQKQGPDSLLQWTPDAQHAVFEWAPNPTSTPSPSTHPPKAPTLLFQALATLSKRGTKCRFLWLSSTSWLPVRAWLVCNTSPFPNKMYIAVPDAATAEAWAGLIARHIRTPTRIQFTVLQGACASAEWWAAQPAPSRDHVCIVDAGVEARTNEAADAALTMFVQQCRCVCLYQSELHPLMHAKHVKHRDTKRSTEWFEPGGNAAATTSASQAQTHIQFHTLLPRKACLDEAAPLAQNAKLSFVLRRLLPDTVPSKSRGRCLLVAQVAASVAPIVDVLQRARGSRARIQGVCHNEESPDAQLAPHVVVTHMDALCNACNPFADTSAWFLNAFKTIVWMGRREPLVEAMTQAPHVHVLQFDTHT